MKECALDKGRQMFGKSMTNVMDTFEANIHELYRDERKNCEPRLVVIDGSNIAGILRGLSGIDSVIKYFKTKGFHKIIVFLRENTVTYYQDQSSRVASWEKAGQLITTPGYSYDDRWILELAKRTNAIVVSADSYTDLIQERHGYFANVVWNNLIEFICRRGEEREEHEEREELTFEERFQPRWCALNLQEMFNIRPKKVYPEYQCKGNQSVVVDACSVFHSSGLGWAGIEIVVDYFLKVYKLKVTIYISKLLASDYNTYFQQRKPATTHKINEDNLHALRCSALNGSLIITNNYNMTNYIRDRESRNVDVLADVYDDKDERFIAEHWVQFRFYEDIFLIQEDPFPYKKFICQFMLE